MLEIGIELLPRFVSVNDCGVPLVLSCCGEKLRLEIERRTAVLGTTSDDVTVRVVLPLLARIVMGYVPGAAPTAAFTVREADPGTAVEEELSVADRPGTSFTPSKLSATFPEKLPTGIRLT